MKAFAAIVLPLVVVGFTVIVLITQVKRKKGNEQAQNYMVEGMCIGMCIGTALGSTGVFNIGIGISLGMLVGECIGLNMKK